MVGALVIAGIAVGAWWYGFHRTVRIPGQVMTQSKTEKSPELKVAKQDVDAAKLPDRFPNSLPLEPGAMVLQNYNATAASGMYQATRTFVTSKTLAENFRVYDDYLKKNDWTIVNSINRDNFKVLSATKGKESLQVTMNEYAGNHRKTVEISYTLP